MRPAAGSSDAKASETVARRPQQHFMIASAAGDTRLPAGVPAWRNVLANLLAGATAGCAVEAGERANSLSVVARTLPQ